jgi:hypothetical protein
MPSTPDTAATSTTSTVSAKRPSSAVSRETPFPLQISDSDCEPLDCEDYPPFLAPPYCLQGRATWSAHRHGEVYEHWKALGLGSRGHGEEFPLCPHGPGRFPGPRGLTTLPVDLSDGSSSGCTSTCDDSDSSAFPMSPPGLSHGSTVSGTSYDAQDTESPDKKPTPPTSVSVTGNTHAASAVVRGTGQTGRGAKRGRAPSDVMSSDQDSQPSRPRRQRTEDRPRVILACPFYKWDPARYRNCRRILLTKISYVKQHILRAHRMPPHCQMCNGSFQTDDQLHQHVRAMTCERQPYTPPDGVTEDQIFRLRSRVNQKNSLEDQWHEVFDIIFPRVPRPTSVYLDPELSEDLDVFVNFLTAQGPKIILEMVNQSALTGDGASGSHPAPSVVTSLSNALQEVYDRWYRERTAGETSTFLPKPLVSGRIEHTPQRPPVRSVSAMSLLGSLPQHETSYAYGGSETYGERAQIRFSPLREATVWNPRQNSSPLAVSAAAGPAHGQSSGTGHVESDTGRERRNERQGGGPASSRQNMKG